MPKRTKVVLLVTAALVTLGSASGAYVYWRGLPLPQTTYYDVVLNRDTKPDVEYKLGAPDDVEAQADISGPLKGLARVYTVNTKPGDQNGLPKGQDYATFDDWVYNPGTTDADVSVSFRKSTATVSEVRCYSMNIVPGACKSLAGVNIGDTEESVRKRLGVPTDASIGGLVKTLVYQDLHVMVLLQKQRVYCIAMGLWVRAK